MGREELVPFPSPLIQYFVLFPSVDAQAVPFSSSELSLIALPVFVFHHAIAQLVVLEPPFEAATLVKLIEAEYLLVMAPISLKVISVGVAIVASPIALPILYTSVIVLLLGEPNAGCSFHQVLFELPLVLRIFPLVKPLPFLLG